MSHLVPRPPVFPGQDLLICEAEQVPGPFATHQGGAPVSYWLYLGLCGQPQNHMWGYHGMAKPGRIKRVLPMTGGGHVRSGWAQSFPASPDWLHTKSESLSRSQFLHLYNGGNCKHNSPHLGLLTVSQLRMEHLQVLIHVTSHEEAVRVADGVEVAHVEEEAGVEPGPVLFSVLLPAFPNRLEEVHEN